MVEAVYIRPLREEDAMISYHWRNDPEVWKFTGRRPEKEITADIEADWIRDVLKRKNERRFAICKSASDRYIGNIQLTDLTHVDGQYHIFIGEKQEWGKGFGKQASELLIEFAQRELKIEKIYLYVSPENRSAIRLYESLGFVKIDHQIRMELVLAGRQYE